MKQKLFKKKKKGIAERKTSTPRHRPIKEMPIRNLLIGALLLILVVYLFYGSGIVSHIDLAIGQRAPGTIVATLDFQCENLKETAFSRSKLHSSIPPVCTINPAPGKQATTLAEKLFDRLKKLYGTPEEQRQPLLNSMADLLINSSINTSEFIELFPSNHVEEAESSLITSLKNVMSKGILSEQYRQTLFRDSASKELIIEDSSSKKFVTMPEEKIASIRSAQSEIGIKLLPFTSGKRDSLLRLLNGMIRDNLVYNEERTETLRQEASSKADPVIQLYTAGTVLIKAGESVNAQHLLLLQKHEEKRQEEREIIDTIMQISGNAILLLVGLVTAIVILKIVAPEEIKKNRHLLLLALLSLLPLGAGKLLLHLAHQYNLISPSLIMYLVPHALPVLLAGILIGGAPAICLGLWTSFATAVLFDSSFNVFALGIIITITATLTARNVHRRASLFRAGLWVCIVEVLYVLTAYILNSPATPVLIGQLWAAALSGLISTVFALLLIPLFEKLFNLTTDITLLELSDMGHPLLQKMAIQAPGTYHHSLMVATLAQNAAEAIGANSLLIRVCAYYHDIGKMAKPDFFTENIQHKENPHDELSPHMSALVITSHVKEGLTLAKRHKLPQPILDAIEQHHGNGLISFFYHKAKMQQEGNSEKLNDADFRYGGHPAVSPEMAILSLADSTEAASRSLEKPSPQKISNLVNDIFTSKIRDGQLDYAQLTMAQINTVKESFVFSLSNMLHGRIPYPKDDENSIDKPTEKATPTADTPDAD
jgi:cyclic-di-AMP phosphodiesterase PgpH